MMKRPNSFKNSGSEDIGKVRKEREGIFGNEGLAMAIQWLPKLGKKEKLSGEGSVVV